MEVSRHPQPGQNANTPRPAPESRRGSPRCRDRILRASAKCPVGQALLIQVLSRRKDAREEPRQSQASVAALTAPDPVVPWQARLSLLGAASLKSGVVEARTKARRRARRQLLGEVLASQLVSAGRRMRPGFRPLGRFRGAVYWPGARWGARGRRAGAARSAGPPSPDRAWGGGAAALGLTWLRNSRKPKGPPADGRKPRVRVRKRPTRGPAQGAQ